MCTRRHLGGTGGTHSACVSPHSADRDAADTSLLHTTSLKQATSDPASLRAVRRPVRAMQAAAAAYQEAFADFTAVGERLFAPAG